MSNYGNVRTGATTSLAEGAQPIFTPEDTRVARVEAAIGVLNMALTNTWPGVLTETDPAVPDTIAQTAETSAGPVTASNAARAANNLHLIQGTVQKPEWN